MLVSRASYLLTQVLKSNQVELLPTADKIIVLDKNGNAVEQGTFEELSVRDGYIHSLSIGKASALKTNENHDSESKILSKPEIFNSIQQAIGPNQLSESSRQTGDIAVYKYYMSTIGIWHFGVFAIVLTALAFFEVFPSEFPFRGPFGE